MLHDAKHNPHLLTSEAELEIDDIDVHHDVVDADSHSDSHSDSKATSPAQ